MTDVTAIVIGGPADAPPGAAAAIAAPGLAALRDAAERADTELVWILGAGASPSPATLPPLLEHASGPAVSLPVDAHGETVEAALGRFDDSDVAALLDDVSERCAPLRHTPVTSMLVDGALVLETDAPDEDRFGPYAGAEWSARLFGRRRGLLVPASRVELRGRVPRSPMHAMRMAGSGSWRRAEALRELHRTIAKAR